MIRQAASVPENTWLGKLIVGMRTLQAVFTTPSPLIAYSSHGTTLTGVRVATFDAAPDRVWHAIYQNVILQPPHTSMADVCAGDTVTFYQDMTSGRGLYWSKIVADCTAVDFPRSIEMRLRAIDEDTSDRIRAVHSVYTLEPSRGGTQLTSRVTDDEAGPADRNALFKSFMSCSMMSDFDRIARNLAPKTPPLVPPTCTPRTIFSSPPRSPTVRRAWGR
jgi:hypothetical protein